MHTRTWKANKANMQLSMLRCMLLTEQCKSIMRFWSFLPELRVHQRERPRPRTQIKPSLSILLDGSLHKMQRVPRVIAPSRSLLDTLLNTQIRECRRSLSSQTSQAARRPAAAQGLTPAQRYRPLVQKRFKYKTVEEAKSRYRSGVRAAIKNPSTYEMTRRLTVPCPTAFLLESRPSLHSYRRWSTLVL